MLASTTNIRSAFYDKHTSNILRNLVRITNYIKLDRQYEVRAHRNSTHERIL